MNKKVVGALAGVVVVAAGAAYFWRSGSTGVLSAAAPGTAAPAAGASAPAGPSVSVQTTRALQRDFEVMLEANGTVTALNTVEVRPQVSSTIRQVHIREGQFVWAGEPLFTLDSRGDEAQVARAEAQLQRDQASLADAKRQLARSRDLLAQGFISQNAVDTNQGLVDAQTALVAADAAARDAARVALSFGQIKAPSAGRAGAINVFPGSLVQPNSPMPLVTITQLNPIAVSFSLPQRNLRHALQALQSQQTGPAAAGTTGAVEAVLPEGAGRLSGRLQFVDNAVDAGSGTVRVKAVFDNREQKLWPGAFVSVRLAVETVRDAILIPQAAIVQSPRGRMVYVVKQGKAVVKPIELLHSAGTNAVVTGLEVGDKVVLEGRQNVRPGGAVIERDPDAGGGGRGDGKGRGGKGGGASAPAGAGDAASTPRGGAFGPASAA